MLIQGCAQPQEQGPDSLEANPSSKNGTRGTKMSFSSQEASGNIEMDFLLNDCPPLCVIALRFYLILPSSYHGCHLSPPSQWGDELPCSVRSRRCDREERNPSRLAQTRVKKRSWLNQSINSRVAVFPPSTRTSPPGSAEHPLRTSRRKDKL